ncbi:MAG: extracellular solute-binding protein, partial [Lachnospiraceae bacterium]|nr:extracellular solute-binding protein [Lachnospiraceae bacterium]
MKVNKRFKKLSLILFATLILMIASGFLFAMLKKEDDSVKITIAVPQSEFVQNFDTNYYTGWLREKTGYEIEFVTISDGYEEEYLQTMLYAKEGRIDMVFLPHQKSYMDKEVLPSFAKEGLLEDLAEYASLGTRMKEMLDEAEFIESLNNEFDGRIYFLPSVDAGKKHNNMQVLWINMGWLKKLSLKVPETTDDLEKVLTAFKDMDPNRNGIQDEIPLITNDTDSAYQSTYSFLTHSSSAHPDTASLNTATQLAPPLDHRDAL